MRGIILAGAIIALAGCVQNQPTIKSSASYPAKPVDMPADNPWYPGETKSVRDLIGKTTVSRGGTTPSGSTYRFYSDGSGSLTNGLSTWSFSCSTDKINDQKKCEISNSSVDLFINYGASSSPRWICSIRHDFPGRTGAIRVDSNKAMTTDTDGCIPGSRISQLLTGKSITVRSVEWPYDYHRDATGPITGLKDAMDLVAHIRKNISKISF